MQIINLTANRPPQSGDEIEIHHDNGAVERKYYFAPVAVSRVDQINARLAQIAAEDAALRAELLAIGG